MQRCWIPGLGGVPPLAVGVNETDGTSDVPLSRDRGDRAVSRDRLADDRSQCSHCVWALWLVVGVQQEVPAERAAAGLGLEKPQAERVQRQGCSCVAAFGPVVGQGGSSGDDVPATIWCRTIFVQANLRR